MCLLLYNVLSHSLVACTAQECIFCDPLLARAYIAVYYSILHCFANIIAPLSTVSTSFCFEDRFACLATLSFALLCPHDGQSSLLQIVFKATSQQAYHIF